MDSHKDLKLYIIKLFVITIFTVFIVEMLLNGLYLCLLEPFLRRTFFLDQILGKKNLFALLIAGFDNFFWIILDNIFSVFPRAISEALQSYVSMRVHNGLFFQYASLQNHFAPQASKLNATLLFFILFVLLLLWFLPFIFATLVFSYLISKKMRAIEEASIAKFEEMEKQKNLLLSDIAHDLKTPITTISGYSGALLRGDVDSSKQQDYLHAIYRKSNQMNDIISVLFEYVRLDSAGFSIHKENENFSELVRNCIATYYSDLEEKQMELAIDLPEEDIFMDFDHIHMERSINNILVNAIKHNPSGTKILIKLKKNHQAILLSIFDNGALIPDALTTYIFDPFVQGDASRSSKSGTGLGLSISRKVTQMHDGKLLLIQNPEKFTPYTKRFLFLFPVVTEDTY